MAQRADLRMGESWTAQQRIKNALIRFAIRTLLWWLDRLPAWLLIGSLRLVGQLAYYLCPRLRKRCETNLRFAFGERLDPELARKCFATAGENLGLCLLLRRKTFRASEKVTIGKEAFELLEQNPGAIVLSAHLGPFELLPAAVREHGLGATIVVRESYDPDLNQAIDHHRLARDLIVIHRGRSGAATALMRALRGGSLLGILPDLPGRGQTIASCPCCHFPKVAAGPLRLAARVPAVLLLATLEPRSGCPRAFELRVEKLTPTEPSAMTHRVISGLNARLQACPEHWLWMAANFG